MSQNDMGVTPAELTSWWQQVCTDIAWATAALSEALTEAGLTREALAELVIPTERAGTLTLEEALAQCEAFATISGALAMTNATQSSLQAQAAQLVAPFATLAGALGGAASAEQATGPAAAVAAAFQSPATRVALAQLVGTMERAAAGMSIPAAIVVPGAARRAPMIPLPFFIVGVAVAILIFSLGSVALAASRVPSSARPVRAFAPSTAISPTASTASSAGTPQASPTTIVSPTPTTDPKTTPPPQPTNSPVIAPPPPPPPAKSVAISQLNQPLCTEAQFTITYRTGQGAVSWSVTSPDPTNIGVGLTRDTTDYGQVSGSLTPGATVVIYVEERNDGAFHGALSVAVSAGAPVTFVSYDTGQCTGG